jgi:hypothetical protein
MSRFWKLIVSSSLLGVCVLGLLWQSRWRPSPFTLEMEVRAERCAHFALYYSGTGLGYRDSVSQMVDSREGFVLVRFPIELLTINSLLLDQWDGAVPVELRKMALKRFDGAVTPITTTKLTPYVGIKEIRDIDGVTRIDPLPYSQRTEVSINLPFQIKAPGGFGRRDRWRSALVCLAALAFLAFAPRRPHRSIEAPTWLTDSRRTYAAVISVLVISFVAASALKLNGSSSGMYRFYADRIDPERGLLFGSPKDIRSDEWMVETPWMLSQFKQDPPFPITNGNVGNTNSTLVNNLPARHWTMLFRPQMWGFFTMGFEQAFACYWNFKWFALLLGAFLFLELVTRGNVLLAITGSLFLWLSSFMQWWWSTPTAMPEMVGMLLLSLWLIAMIFRSATKLRVAVASVLLVATWMQFVLCCYPRFQIPLFYLGAVMIFSGFWRNSAADRFPWYRRLCLAVAIVASIGLVGLWYSEVADVIRETGNLLYPGRTSSKGGDYPWAGLFAPFLSTPMTWELYPRLFGNVGEASGFLFVLPALAAAVIRNVRRRTLDPVLFLSVGFACFAVYFMTVGIPDWLARSTGWSYVYALRAQLVLGVASTIALFRYLAVETSNQKLPSFLTEAALLVLIASSLAWVFSVTNAKVGNFLPTTGVITAAAFFGLLFVCLWSGRVGPACVLLVAPFLCTNAAINPLGRRLPAFAESDLYRSISTLHQQTPSGQWLILGLSPRSSALAQFVKAAGADVIGGTRCNPDAHLVQALDPLNKYAAVHQRYADVSFVPTVDDEVSFELKHVQVYIVHLPLRSDVFDRLGVRFVLETEIPEEENKIPGFRTVERQDRYRILQRESGPSD